MTEFDLVREISSLRRNHIHGMKNQGRSGVALHLLWQSVSERICIDKLLLFIRKARDSGEVLIVGRKGFHEGRGPLVVVESELDQDFLVSERRWKQGVEGNESYYHHLRLYIVADGLPSSLVKQSVVRRALERLQDTTTQKPLD